MSTQDAISAEEQRQIDEAIALSLGDSSQTRVLATTSTSISTSTKQQPGRGADLPILLDDDSSSDIEPVTQGRGNSKPVLKNVGESGDAIASSKKKVPRNDPLSEVDTSATEEDSDVEQPTLPASISLKHKTDDEIDAIDVTRTSKKAKYVTDEPNYATEADEDSKQQLNIQNRTDNMNPSRYILGGMDRAEMEKQRLARVAARQAQQQANDSSTGVGAPTSSRLPGISARPSQGRVATLSMLTETDEQTPILPQTRGKEDSASVSKFGTLAGLTKRNESVRYWKGIVRPTSSSSHAGYECFTFKDVVGDTSDLQSALLASFCGEPEWIHSHFPESTKVALVMPCMEHTRHQIIQVAPNMRIINPVREVESRGVMHIKLVLLYHKTYLRVAVSTANLINYDWSTIENAVYVQDFPRVSTSSDPETTPFLKTLIRSHKSLGTPTELWKTALLPFDFSKASRVRLILSVPGNFKSPSDLATTGHTGLSRSLQDLGLVLPPSGAALEVEAQGSSIGSYTLDWMKTFYRSCLGWDPKSPNIRTASSKQVVQYARPTDWPNIKIVYPTFATVKNSINGVNGGGTIFCPLDYWKKPSFPKDLFYDSRSKREGLLQHTKMLLSIASPLANLPKAASGQLKLKTPAGGTSSSTAETQFSPFGWLYVGSHNFTPAAWGRYSEKTGNLSIANHELGVIVPLEEADLQAEGSFLATWKRPLDKYKPSDTPWDQHKYRDGQ